MKRTLVIRAAASVLMLSFGCTANDVAHDDPTAPKPEPAPGPELPTSPLPADEPGTPGAPCMLDADCGAGNFCELRICVTGCPAVAPCGADEVCDPHGRCTAPEDDPAQSLAGTPALTDRVTVLAFGETQAHTTLRNDGAGR